MLRFLRRVLGRPPKAAERRKAERIAAAYFSRLHPDLYIAWTRLAADEPERFVVGVFHGVTLPPSYSFYAVSKATSEVTPIDDESPYRPKVWR